MCAHYARRVKKKHVTTRNILVLPKFIRFGRQLRHDTRSNLATFSFLFLYFCKGDLYPEICALRVADLIRGRGRDWLPLVRAAYPLGINGL
jgi:hypothetical protein